MNVNVVVAGHVDHGKSTSLGRLLYDSGSVKEGRVAEIQSLADEYKRRFEFAYFLDSYEEEFSRKVERFLSLLEPVMILIMGLVVGLIVLAVLLPIFQLNQLIQ